MSKKYVIGLDPNKISKLGRDFKTQVFLKGRQLDELPKHLQEQSLQYIFGTCFPHLKKSPVVERLNQFHAEYENKSDYEDALFELIDKIDEGEEKSLSNLHRVKDEIVGLVKKKIKTLDDYHAAVVNVVRRYEKESQISKTHMDHAERVGYFEGKRIPQFSHEEFEEKAEEFFSSGSYPLDEAVIKFILCFYHQDALENIRFFFSSQFKNVFSPDNRVNFNYDRKHKFDLVSDDDGSAKFYFVEYMLSKDPSKGLLAIQRYTFHVRKNIDANIGIVSDEEFSDIEVNVENLSFEIFDEQYFQFLMSIELPVTIEKITKAGGVSAVDESFFQACAKFYAGYDSVKKLNKALDENNIDGFGLFALCWSSHFFRSIIINNDSLCAELKKLPGTQALFAKLMDRSYDSRIVRKLQVREVSSPPRKKGVKRRLVTSFDDSDEDLDEVKYFQRENELDACKIKLLKIKKQGKLVKLCNTSQAGEDDADRERLVFKAFVSLFKNSPEKYFDAFLKMSVDLHQECLNDIYFIQALLFSHAEQLSDKKQLVDLALDTLKNKYDVYPEIAKTCFHALIPHLDKAYRRKMLHDELWQQIFFKMTSNELSNLSFMRLLTQDVDRGFWLVLQGGDKMQWRSFMMALYAKNQDLQPKKQPLERVLKKITKKRKRLSAELETTRNATILNAQSAALTKGVDIDAAEEKAKDNTNKLHELSEKLNEINDTEEEAKEKLRRLNDQVTSIEQFTRLMLEDSEKLGNNVLMFEMLGLMYMSSDVQLWTYYKEKFAVPDDDYRAMQVLMNVSQGAYFIGESDDVHLGERIRHLSALLPNPELLVSRIAEDLSEFEDPEKLLSYLDDIVKTQTVLEQVFNANNAVDLLNTLYLAVMNNNHLSEEEQKQAVREKFEILVDKVLFSSLNSAKRLEYVFRKGNLPDYIVECATFDILTLFVMAALSCSNKPYNIPECYIKRLQEAEERIPFTIELLQTRFGLGAWIFKLFDQWEEPHEKATELLEKAYHETVDRTAPSVEMIEFLSGLTKKNLIKYVQDFFGASVEEWVPVFARYPKHKRMVELLLRLPEDSSEFASIAQVMLSKPVLDSVILSTEPNILLKLVGRLPKSLSRMRELFVLDEKFRLSILKSKRLVKKLYADLTIQQSIELDIKSIKLLNYDSIKKDLTTLSPDLLRRAFVCLFNRNDSQIKYFLNKEVVSLMLENTVDRSEFEILPQLVRSLEKYREEIDAVDISGCVFEKIECKDFEFAFLDVEPSVLVDVVKLPPKAKESSRLRDAFLASDMLLMRLFLESEDAKLAMLLRRGESDVLKWLTSKFRVNSSPLKSSADTGPIEQLSSRLIASEYSSREKNTSLLGSLISGIELVKLNRFLVNDELTDRIVLQLVHTVGNVKDDVPLLVNILLKKINTNDGMASYLKAFVQLNNAFLRLEPMHQTRDFYQAWRAFLELTLAKIVQYQIKSAKLSEMGRDILSVHQWSVIDDRAIIIRSKSVEGSDANLHFPCPQLYFLLEMASNPQQLLKEFARKKIGLSVCKEFLSCVDETEGAIQLSGDVKIPWLSCVHSFSQAAEAFKSSHDKQVKITDTIFSETIEKIFHKPRINSKDLSFNVLTPEDSHGESFYESGSDDEDNTSTSDDDDQAQKKKRNGKCLLM